MTRTEDCSIKITFSTNLLDLFDPKKGSDFLDQIRNLREELKQENNYKLPPIRVMDVNNLDDNIVLISIDNKVVSAKVVEKTDEESKNTIIAELKKSVL